MILSDFIAASVSEIIEGIEKARAVAKDKGVQVSPNDLTAFDSSRMAVYNPMQGISALVNVVEFEVSVEDVSTSESAKGAKLMLSVVGGGLTDKKGGGSTARNIVRFAVPMTYPKYTDESVQRNPTP